MISKPAVSRFSFSGEIVMKIKDPQAKEKLLQRLRRIEGQVHGVQGMLDDERDCREIIQQLTAIHSAVQSASRFFLQEYAAACLVEMEKGSGSKGDPVLRKEREKIIQDMITLLDKAP
jgi:DNA-binding FrmR family transcriptional regulator